MGPAQIAALENCGIQVEDATGDIKFREFEFIDVVKPDPIKVPQSNIQYEDPLREATKLPNYNKVCLLYTSPSPRDRQKSRMPSSA